MRGLSHLTNNDLIDYKEEIHEYNEEKTDG
jgi:hypothetical protein